MSNYQEVITTSLPKNRVFDIITLEMSDWWTTMSGKFEKPGDKAKTDFGAKSYWTFEATKLDAPDLIELRCCDANHIHEGLSDSIKEEWLDTHLKFEISDHDGVTQVCFTHIGLTPELECYEVCKQGWDHYFVGSLKNYLDNKSA